MRIVEINATSVGNVLKPAGLESGKGLINTNYGKEPLDSQWKGDSGMKRYFAFMEEYYRRWNAKDAEGLAEHIYRLAPGRPLRTPADFERLLGQLAAEGWDHSSLSQMEVFPWGDAAWLVRGLFCRHAADGSVLPPADRLTAYVVERFPDGLRITDLPLVYDRTPSGKDASST